MKVCVQIVMVLNLDKCIGCYICLIICKNVWILCEGVEYVWFNNVEIKFGIGYLKEWENQDKWNGGWVCICVGKLVLCVGGCWCMLVKIFVNLDLLQIDDYYELFDFDYQNLYIVKNSQYQLIVCLCLLISGECMQKIEWGLNWEEIFGLEFSKCLCDYNFDWVQKEIYGVFEKIFMMYLLCLCEYCLNLVCVLVCFLGVIYKCEEDGIVLIDQDKCRGWCMCVLVCLYKKIYYNWKSGKLEKCIFCYLCIEMGELIVCLEICVGCICYLGVMLYDVDCIVEVVLVVVEKDFYQVYLDIFLDLNDLVVIVVVCKEGILDSWLELVKQLLVYKLVIDWKLVLLLYLEYCMLLMVWYVLLLLLIQFVVECGCVGMSGELLDVVLLCILMCYLVNLLMVGDEVLVVCVLEWLMVMCVWCWVKNVDGVEDIVVLEQIGLSIVQVEEMYCYLVIVNYEDCFVILIGYCEYVNDVFGECGGCGFIFGNGCNGDSLVDLFGQCKIIILVVDKGLNYCCKEVV